MKMALKITYKLSFSLCTFHFLNKDNFNTWWRFNQFILYLELYKIRVPIILKVKFNMANSGANLILAAINFTPKDKSKAMVVLLTLKMRASELEAAGNTMKSVSILDPLCDKITKLPLATLQTELTTNLSVLMQELGTEQFELWSQIKTTTTSIKSTPDPLESAFLQRWSDRLTEQAGNRFIFQYKQGDSSSAKTNYFQNVKCKSKLKQEVKLHYVEDLVEFQKTAEGMGYMVDFNLMKMLISVLPSAIKDKLKEQEIILAFHNFSELVNIIESIKESLGQSLDKVQAITRLLKMRLNKQKSVNEFAKTVTKLFNIANITTWDDKKTYLSKMVTTEKEALYLLDATKMEDLVANLLKEEQVRVMLKKPNQVNSITVAANENNNYNNNNNSNSSRSSSSNTLGNYSYTYSTGDIFQHTITQTQSPVYTLSTQLLNQDNSCQSLKLHLLWEEE